MALAQQLIEIRSLVPEKDGSDQNQDRMPFRQMTQAVGHAVRANYLYAGVADVAYTDFEPICLISSTPSVLTASPKTPWNDWKGLLADAKVFDKADGLSWASGDRTRTETNLLDCWPTTGPPILWEKPIGTGYSRTIKPDDARKYFGVAEDTDGALMLTTSDAEATRAANGAG